MKKFFTPVDLRSRAAMTAYLDGHFRYPTMNSWNQATSYACNLKVDHLGLDASVVETVSYDHTESGWAYNSTEKGAIPSA